MSDYTWPSVYFAYLFFGMCVAFAVYFFARSFRDGYWGREAEEIKYLMFEDRPLADARGSVSGSTADTEPRP
jgi:hypothetical protein